MAHWTPVTVYANHEKDLVLHVCQEIGCGHPHKIQFYAYSGSARAIKLYCPECGRLVFIKSFYYDDVDNEEKKSRVDAERENIAFITANYAANDELCVPQVIGSFHEPFFALIEEFSDYEPFLNSLSSTCINPANEGKLYTDLNALAKNLADFHDSLRAKRPTDEAVFFRHNFDVREPLRRIVEKGYFENLSGEISALQGDWEQSESLLRASEVKTVVHGGLSTVNMLFSNDSKIKLIDLETLHINTPLIDIGHITAEIKLAFYVYGNRDEQVSEKFISFFLQRYFFYSRIINFRYRQYTLAQAYYMGLQLLNTATSEHLDSEIRYWCAETALNTWRLIRRERDYLSPPFRGKRGIFFDFYNTLVTIIDDERNERNFEVARGYLMDKFGCPEEKVPSAAQLKEMYFHVIDMTYTENSKVKQHPDIDLEHIWKTIFINEDIVSPSELESNAGKSKIKGFLLEFRQSAIKEFFPEPLAVETLRKLGAHGVKIGIISDAQPTYFERELQKAGFHEIASKYFLSVTYGVRKPSAELFDNALKSMNQMPEDVVFVGDDMFRDIYGAKNKGISTVYKPSEHGAAYYNECTPDEVIKEIREILFLFGIEEPHDRVAHRG
jgi:putative hydrolase of the HAD superfamily